MTNKEKIKLIAIAFAKAAAPRLALIGVGAVLGYFGADLPVWAQQGLMAAVGMAMGLF